MMLPYRIGRAVCRLVNLIWHKYEIKGKENIPQEGNCIICANHVNVYDPVAIGTKVERQVHFLAKAELYTNPVLRWLLLNFGTIPVNREHVSIDTLRKALGILKDGGVLGIFPEGTRVAQGERPKPMDGFVVFALKTRSPIVPVHIQGDFGFRKKIKMTFGEPIDLKEYYGKKLKSEEISKISKKVMDIIYNLQ